MQMIDASTLLTSQKLGPRPLAKNSIQANIDVSSCVVIYPHAYLHAFFCRSVLTLALLVVDKSQARQQCDIEPHTSAKATKLKKPLFNRPPWSKPADGAKANPFAGPSDGTTPHTALH